jgi:hypothetical protein
MSLASARAFGLQALSAQSPAKYMPTKAVLYKGDVKSLPQLGTCQFTRGFSLA